MAGKRSASGSCSVAREQLHAGDQTPGPAEHHVPVRSGLVVTKPVRQTASRSSDGDELKRPDLAVFGGQRGAMSVERLAKVLRVESGVTQTINQIGNDGRRDAAGVLLEES